MTELRIDKWQLDIIRLPLAYRRVVDLTLDEEAVDLHVRNVVEETGERDPRLGAQVADLLKSGIGEGTSTLSQLMLVLAASVLEDVLLEFFENLLSAQSGLLSEYRDEKGNPLSAGDAAARARLGGPSKFLPRVSRFTGYVLDPDVAAEVTDLVELRNRIIHDGALPKVSPDDVEESFHTVHRFLRQLGLASVAGGASVRDRANLLGS